MNVWLMNLRDNRDNPVRDLDMTKFEFCKSKGILGIGWVGYDESSDDSAFLLANNYLNSFAVGDLVWTKDPENKVIYLCKVNSHVQSTDTAFNKYDISKYCKCDYIEIGSADNLPEGISKENLISRRTITKANNRIANATVEFYDKIR